MARKFLDYAGLQRFWTGLKGYFVKQETGKGLSSNDYTDAEKTKLAGLSNYTHPTAAGNKHIPAGGQSGQILRWSAAGTAEWGTDKDTTYTAMSGATAEAAGGAGLVPAPAAGTQGKYLRADGTWQTPPNTTYGAATASKAGLMSAADKVKMDGLHEVASSGSYNALKDKPTIPTNNNQLANGAGYQTAAQVAQAVANADHLKRSIVETLPAVASADAHTIYMVKTASATGDDKYIEWMAVDGAWEKIGDSNVDLTDYLRTDDMASITDAEIDAIVA